MAYALSLAGENHLDYLTGGAFYTQGKDALRDRELRKLQTVSLQQERCRMSILEFIEVKGSKSARIASAGGSEAILIYV